MVGKWHLGFQENGYDQPLPGGPVDCGFDTFFGFRASTDIPPYFYIKNDRALVPPTVPIEASATPGWSPIQGAFWRAGEIAPDLQLADVLPRLTEEAVSVIRQHAASPRERDEPLMLYFALTAPHTPWLPSDEFSGKSPAEMYGDFSMMVDAMIGRVLQTLDDTQLAKDTLVIFSSDNGPTWYPEDVRRTGHDSAGGFRGMKGLSWEAGHRVPFIVRWPGKVRAGAVSEQLICFTDVLATLAQITGAQLPASAGPDSVSFLSALLDGQPKSQQPDAQPLRRSLVVGNSYRSGNWKWIAGHEPASFSRPDLGFVPPKDAPPGQLFDLAADPAETTNLAQQRPEIVARLEQELAAIKRPPRKN
jgi:arylsulfatase A-like enzyme